MTAYLKVHDSRVADVLVALPDGPELGWMLFATTMSIG